MPRLLAPAALLALGLLLGACREAPEAPAAAGTANPDVVTPAEVDPSAVPPDDGPPLEPGGEPGVPGSPRPEASYRLADGRCHVYPGWVVVVRPREGVPGEDVAVRRRDGADARALCTAPPGDAAFALADPASPDYFFGLAGDLLFVDTGTGPDGRTLRLVDLAAGQTVLQAGYEEPVEVDGGVLTFTEPVDDFASAEAVAATGVACPQAAEWFESGFAVGVNRVVRYDLATRQRDDTGERVCVPLQ
jgi:hypothetical protein